MHCCAGYVKFLFFLARGVKIAILKQLLRVGVYAMGRTLIQPFHKVSAVSVLLHDEDLSPISLGAGVLLAGGQC